MRVKQLAVNRFEVVGVMDGDACPAELFLLEGEKATEANRLGLTQILATVAERGFGWGAFGVGSRGEQIREDLRVHKGPIAPVFLQRQKWANCGLHFRRSEIWPKGR
ncbi:MAG: hypothetical protein IPH23_02355 [Gammaproteobacteria bacterium]|nr:hypothetical protein [Gammaproteobacteria bacterium]